MVGLHAILVMRRLRAEGRQGRIAAQALFDLMFQDVDGHLREWGVGDLSVGKQVKRLAHNFLGRAAALDPLLDGADPAALEAVLQRNVYSEVGAPAPEHVAKLGRYLCAQQRRLAAADGAALLAGQVPFEPPEQCVCDEGVMEPVPR
jgi:cytochrome b pre-mRNA-processing protein 3